MGKQCTELMASFRLHPSKGYNYANGCTLIVANAFSFSIFLCLLLSQILQLTAGLSPKYKEIGFSVTRSGE